MKNIGLITGSEPVHECIVASSAVVSRIPGRLLGILVIDPGSSGSVVVHDSAASATGRRLMSASGSLLQHCAYLEPSPDCEEALEGIFVSIEGTKRPVVLVLYQGEDPCAPPAERPNVYYFDGADGNNSWDGQAATYEGGTRGPRRSLVGNDYNAADCTLYLKSGTEIAIESNITPVGSITIAPYPGDAGRGLPKPVLYPADYQIAAISVVGDNVRVTLNVTHNYVASDTQVPSVTIKDVDPPEFNGTFPIRLIKDEKKYFEYTLALPGGPSKAPVGGRVTGAKSISFHHLGAGKLVHISGVAYRGNIATRTGGIPAIASESVDGRLIVDGVDIQGFANGIRFCNSGNIFRAVTTADMHVSSIYGGESSKAHPRYALITKCNLGERGLRARDAVSFHDGTGVGGWHVVWRSVCYAGAENCLDLPQLKGGGTCTNVLCGFSTLYGGGSLYCVGTGIAASPNLALIGCTLKSHGYAAVLLRGPGAAVIGNVIEVTASTNGDGGALAISGSGAKIFHNVLSCLDSSGRKCVQTEPGSGGSFKNNVVISNSAAPGDLIYVKGTAADLGLWDFNHNWYSSPSPKPFYTESAPQPWTYIEWREVQDKSSLPISPDVPRSVLLLDRKVPKGSPLIGSGARLGVRYLGRFEPMWSESRPTIGVHEPFYA